MTCESDDGSLEVDDLSSQREGVSKTSRVLFLAAFGMVAWVWLVVLPRQSRVSGNREQIERLESLGIDGGATYYTELPDELFADAR